MLMVDGADYRQLIHSLGHARQELGDANTGHGGFNRLENPTNLLRRIGLGVPQVQVARRATVENQDDRARLGRDGP